MIQKKVALLGASGVGKTSLVRQFVDSLFDDKYLTTIGVKVDKKVVAVDGREVTLMVWDVFGQDDFQTVGATELRGMSGYLLVVDGTRRQTLDTARDLQERATAAVGPVPFILLLNKSDLAAQWALSAEEEAALGRRGPVFRTSARSAERVEEAFLELARRVTPPPD